MLHRAPSPTAPARIGLPIATALALFVALPAQSQTMSGDAPDGDDVTEISVVPSPAELATMAREQLVRADGIAGQHSEKAEALRLAARYFHHAGELGDARQALAEAALVFYRSGDDSRAAQTFLDAAGVADEADRRSEARKLADLAGTVLRGATLTENERSAVLSRVHYVEIEAHAGTDHGLVIS